MDTNHDKMPGSSIDEGLVEGKEGRVGGGGRSWASDNNPKAKDGFALCSME